jgi:uncharacterized membrane protein YdcZ (DUF606 family)
MLYSIARISTYWSKKMKKLLAALVTTLAVGVAQSATIVLDDFGTNQGPISDLTNNGAAICDNNGTRTICSNLIAAAPPVTQVTDVSFGAYTVDNGGGENSTQSISWALGANPALVGATNASFLFQVLYSDGNPINLNFTYNGVALAPYVIPGNTTNAPVSFSIPSALQLGTAGTLSLIITGQTGWDLGLDSFGLSFTPAAIVPAPALPLIFGAGLIALALRRKQK